MVPTKSTLTPGPVRPFPSLAALRARHTELLHLVPTAGPAEEHLAAVQTFVQQAAATGTLLDLPAERDAAQGLLDYWKATLYTQNRCKERETPESEDERTRLPAALLEDFDEVTARTLVAAAENKLQALSQQDPMLTDAARLALLRLVQLSETGTAFELVARARAELLTGGDCARVELVLVALVQAGVLEEMPATGTLKARVQLRYGALTRIWPRLAGWLEKRVLFRDAALFWDKHNRDRGALFVGSLLAEADDYRDRNALESLFVQQCHAEAQRQEQEAAERKERLENEKNKTRRIRRHRLVLIYALVVLVLAGLCAVLVFDSWSKSAEAAAAQRDMNRRGLGVLGVRRINELEKLLLSPSAPIPGRPGEERNLRRKLKLLDELRSPGPIRPGASISLTKFGSGGGSVCCVVKKQGDRTGARYILTADYVLFGGKIGDVIIHPALVDVSPDAAHQELAREFGVAELRAALASVPKEAPGHALVKLRPDVPASNALPALEELQGADRIGSHVGENELRTTPLRVMMIGSGSGFKGPVAIKWKDGLGITAGPIAGPSDAGAPVLSVPDGRLVGFIYRTTYDECWEKPGGEVPRATRVILADRVFRRAKIELP